MLEGERSAALVYEALGRRRGRGRLVLDTDEASGCSELSPTLMGGFHEGLNIGLDRRAPVDWVLCERHGVFRYSGKIHDVFIESGPIAPDLSFAGADRIFVVFSGDVAAVASIAHQLAAINRERGPWGRPQKSSVVAARGLQQLAARLLCVGFRGERGVCWDWFPQLSSAS